MSFGHESIYDDDVLPDALRALIRIEREYPEAQEFVDSDFSFSHKWDIPWVAGRNLSCSRVYIDRHCRIIRQLRRSVSGDNRGPTSSFDRKISINVTSFLAEHERWEWWLMNKLKYKYEIKGDGAHSAHHIATAAEQRKVLRAGVDWDSYRSEMRKDIKKDNDPRIERCPPDLDVEPYEEDGNEKLLRRILECMNSKARKSAHTLFARR